MKVKKILIAEDEEPIRRVLTILLNSAGYSVEEAQDGREALKKLFASPGMSCPIDLLLTDIFMPRMGGLELIDEIRKRKPDLPILVITAYLDNRLQAQLLRKGCSNPIAKPFEADALIEHVAQAFEEEKRIQVDSDEEVGKQMTHSRDLKK